MRRISKSLGLLVLVIVCILSLGSCKSPRAPENLTVDFWEARWDAVEGAEEYVVELDGKEYRTKDTDFELFEFLRPDERITVRVEPVFAGDQRKDLWTDEVVYTAESVTEGLVYTDLGDGTYAVCCPDEVVLENGELVLPDTYEGALVVEFRNANNESTSLALSLFGDKKSDYNGPVAAKIQKIRLPSQLQEIRKGALYKANIKRIYIPGSVTELGSSAFEECDSLERIVNAEGIARIDSYAFCGCASLIEFEIPKKAVYIGAGAFIGTGITKAVIPNGITTLCGYTFYNCTSLLEITLPESLKTIYPKTFENTAWYHAQPDGVVYIDKFVYGYKGEMPENTKIVIPKGITDMVFQDAFKNQRNLVSVTIPEGFDEINIATFYGCENLSEVILPKGITTILNDAFYGCKNLKEIHLPDSIQKLCGGAFYGCGLEEIVLPENIIYVGTQGNRVGLFEGCENLREIVIPQNAKHLGRRCFYGCSKLEKIEIGNAVETIGDDAFLYCSSLSELTIPDSVTSFKFNSIAYTNITHFVFPKNLKPTKPFYMPKYADGVLPEYLVIQKGTLYLDYNWFYIYPTLKSFFYEGTANEYEYVTKDSTAYSSWSGVTSQEGIDEWASRLTVYFYSETKPTEEGNYWRYVNGIPVVW